MPYFYIWAAGHVKTPGQYELYFRRRWSGPLTLYVSWWQRGLVFVLFLKFFCLSPHLPGVIPDPETSSPPSSHPRLLLPPSPSQLIITCLHTCPSFLFSVKEYIYLSTSSWRFPDCLQPLRPALVLSTFLLISPAHFWFLPDACSLFGLLLPLLLTCLLTWLLNHTCSTSVSCFWVHTTLPTYVTVTKLHIDMLLKG